ncbi:Ig-like domain-containing protein [Macrococcus bovicus]|uniref:Ig-like domain-containing protein n=1 Tax=Macrococcus bovicus TaxID=69968 RepID=UPI0025A6712A|nr:Ig-like domain-containing protein [Macrococcus bovicus]WJP98497.1 Ig-like domain-containing protein [Macrococcus bovicus]
MMNRILKGLMIMLLFITLLPTQALAVVTPCIDTVFKLTAPVPGDVKLTGEALSDNELTIKIDDQLHKLTVKPDGKYELELPTALTGDEKIEVQQGLNKLEASVEEEPAEKELLLETPFDCTGLVAPSTEEQTTEEPLSEDVSTEAPSTEKATTEKPSTEAATTEQQSTEKTTTEAPTTKDVTTEEPSTEQVTTEVPVSDELTTEDVTTEDVTTEDVTTEEPSTEALQSEKVEEPVTEDPSSEQVTTERPTTEAPISEIMTTEAPFKSLTTFRRTFSLMSPAANSTLTSCRPLSDYSIGKLGGAITKSVNGTIKCVSNAADFSTAVQDDSIEVIVLTADITSTVANVPKSSTGQKIIDVNNYSLTLTHQDGLRITSASNISDLIIANAQNLLTTANDYQRGFVSVAAEKSAHIRYYNVKYNSGTLTAGHIGKAINSTLHFYGNDTLNIAGADTVTNYQYVIVHSGANVTMTNNNQGLNQYGLLFNDTTNDKSGLQLEANATLTINAPNADGVHFNTNKPYEVKVGTNSSLVINANKGIYLSPGPGGEMTFEEGSNVKIETRLNAIRFNDHSHILNIQRNAKVEMKSTDEVFTALDLSGVSVTVNVMENATLSIERTGSGNSPAFTIDRPITYNINNSAKVNFINTDGSFFDGSEHQTFRIKNMVVSGWTLANKTDKPDKQTPLISDNYFTMAPTTTSGPGMLPTTFNTDFSTTKIRRLQIAAAAAQPVPDKVYDDSTVVTGTAQPGATVMMLIKRSNVVISAVANNGTFSIPVKVGQLQAGDILEFSSTLNNTNSPIVTRTVIGTVLELLQPPDITFKTTAIDNKPGLIINRASPVDYAVRVKDTKTTGSWNLAVQATTQMTSSKRDVLDDALIFKDGTTISSLKSAIKVTDKSKVTATSTSGEFEQKWSSDNGILLKMNPIKAAADTYTGTLTWTLTSGP